jgi:hypothetical protein
MYCSTCGSLIPRGRAECGTCGTPVRTGQSGSLHPAFEGSEERPVAADRFGQQAAFAVGECPRCAYRGQGLPYFTRGPHMAALIGAALFTLPYALGAGGFLYYGLRRDHRVCPRCGFGWGKFGRMALPVEHRLNLTAGGVPVVHSDRGMTRPARGGRISSATEQFSRVWSAILLMLGALTLAVGVVQTELVIFTFGMLAAAGGVALHRSANRAREERRLAMIASMQTPVLQLAADRKGRLTVTDVAASLGWPLRRAEKVLQSLDDGWRVNSDVTDEGVIIYEFREITLGGDAFKELEGNTDAS